MRKRLIIFICFLLFALSGCVHRDRTHNELGVPDYTIANVYIAADYPVDLRRVVVLPVMMENNSVATLDQLDATFRAEVAQRRAFELVLPGREELREVFASEGFASQDPVPFGFFEHWKERYSADAVLFIDIAHYRPYRPLQVGVRARLVHLTSEKTVWAVDEIFDAGNPQVAVSAQRFHRSYNDAPYPANTTGSVLQSPARFSKYVAWQVFQSLPQNAAGG